MQMHLSMTYIHRCRTGGSRWATMDTCARQRSSDGALSRSHCQQWLGFEAVHRLCDGLFVAVTTRERLKKEIEGGCALITLYFRLTYCFLTAPPVVFSPQTKDWAKRQLCYDGFDDLTTSLWRGYKPVWSSWEAWAVNNQTSRSGRLFKSEQESSSRFSPVSPATVCTLHCGVIAPGMGSLFATSDYYIFHMIWGEKTKAERLREVATRRSFVEEEFASCPSQYRLGINIISCFKLSVALITSSIRVGCGWVRTAPNVRRHWKEMK